MRTDEGGCVKGKEGPLPAGTTGRTDEAGGLTQKAVDLKDDPFWESMTAEVRSRRREMDQEYAGEDE